MSDIDPRILHILKTIAVEKLTYDDNDSWCGFCGGDEIWPRPQFDQVTHKPDCDMLLARMLLKEIGMPLYGYSVSYEAPRWETERKISEWFPVVRFIEAFSEHEISKEFPEGSGKPICHVPYYRNVKIERMAEL